MPEDEAMDLLNVNESADDNGNFTSFAGLTMQSNLTKTRMESRASDIYNLRGSIKLTGKVNLGIGEEIIDCNSYMSVADSSSEYMDCSPSDLSKFKGSKMGSTI